jgi:diguanylate cyclase (GGDEF)-like protein
VKIIVPQFSLRSFLVIPFLLLFLSATALIGWVSYRSGMESVEQFETQMASEISERIAAHLDRFFSSAVLVAESTAEAISSGQVNPDRSEDLQRQFVGKMRNQPYLTFISFGQADGQYVGATRLLESNEIRLMTALKNEGMTINTYSINEKNTRDTLITHGPEFYATSRGWYKQAQTAGKLSWYPVYKYKPYESLGIGVSVPIYKGKQLLGVATGDVALTQISRYLHSLPVGKTGLSFVAETSGELIASSLKAPVFKVDGDTVTRTTLLNHRDPRIRQAGEWLKSTQGNTSQAFIEIENERYLIELRHHRDDHGLHLLIGVLLPEHDFSSTLIANIKLVAWLTLAIALIGAICGIALTNQLIQPIAKINQRATRLASREWSADSMADTNAPVRELNTLSQNFNTMANQLQEAFINLETRVAERTRELEAANNELAKIATQDGLTHIANRRRLDEFLQQEWLRCTRQNQPISILMLDVDHFKAYNDTYGHPAGDQVLIQIAALCEAQTGRSTDLTARYGGEEFAIVLSHTDASGALKVAQSINKFIQNLAIPHVKSLAAEVVTVSIGVATTQPSGISNPATLIASADSALYAAKNMGRNRVEVAGKQTV